MKKKNNYITMAGDNISSSDSESIKSTEECFEVKENDSISDSDEEPSVSNQTENNQIPKNKVIKSNF